MRNREISLLMCGALALGGCGKREVAVETKAGPPPAASVHVVELKEESFLGTLAITGSLVSRSVVDLKAETIGRIGCYAYGRPYVVPITYAYDGVAVYAHSREGLKLRAMRSNPGVCFEVDRMASLSEWSSVIAMGRYSCASDIACCPR